MILFGMKRWENHGTTSENKQVLLFYFGKIFIYLDGLVYFFKSILEFLEFQIFLKQFPAVIKLRSKNKLLIHLFKLLKSDKNNEQIDIYEFGVAFGETSIFIQQYANFTYSYNGFDTFTGLPEKWRNLPAGAISANGQVPKIDDKRFNFHVGLVETTFPKLDINKNSRKFILLDLDLFSPTLFVVNHFIPYLKSGDLVVFDEAFDSAERLIINEYFLKKLEAKLIVSTPFSACFLIQ